MRTCTKCSITKPESDFFVRDQTTGRLHAQCKGCYKQHRKTYYAAHYQKHKEAYLLRAKKRRKRPREEFHINILTYLAYKRCVVCSEDDIRVLELDHIDPSTKHFSISQAIKLGFKWEEVVGELKNCQVLCANCHKRRTAQQFNWYKA